MPYMIGTKLFQMGEFISHAGLKLPWKIECDAISPEEWNALARMVIDYQKESFSKAVGIPRGGIPFADALNEYGSGDPNDPILIADDVYTTGTSFNQFISENYSNQKVIKWCVFARSPTQNNVNALFTMPELATGAGFEPASLLARDEQSRVFTDFTTQQ